MEDPTGGLWIYLIFLLIQLTRILPRILRKYRRKNAGSESDEQHSQEGFFAIDLLLKRPRFRQVPPEQPRFREKEPPEPQPKPEKKDGWVGKDDFK